MTRAWGGLGLLLLVLHGTACAPTFTRATVPPDQQARDLAECRERQEQVGQMPTGPYGGLILAFGLMSWRARRAQVLEDCMLGKGYVKE